MTYAWKSSAALSVFFILKCGAAFAQDTASLLTPKPLTDKQLELVSRAENVRGLRLIQPIQYLDLSQNESGVSGATAGDDAKQSKAFAARGKLLTALGLVPEGTDLKSKKEANQKRSEYAHYDLKQNTIFVSRSMKVDRKWRKPLFVHEVTHALQSQNFGINSLQDSGSDDSWAWLALFEGDATFTHMQFAAEKSHSTYERILDKNVAKQRRKRDSTPWLVTSLPESLLIFDSSAPQVMAAAFMYIFGRDFVHYGYKKGGWAAINQAYQDRPKSTEQILHPEKYFDEREDPVVVSMIEKSFPKKLGAVVAYKTIGEWTLRCMLDMYLPQATAIAAAAGWAGDETLVAESAEGGLSLILNSTWDTELDAKEFFSAYVERTRARFGGTLASVNGPKGQFSESLSFSTSELMITILRIEKDVSIFEHPLKMPDPATKPSTN